MSLHPAHLKQKISNSSHISLFFFFFVITAGLLAPPLEAATSLIDADHTAHTQAR